MPSHGNTAIAIFKIIVHPIIDTINTRPCINIISKNTKIYEVVIVFRKYLRISVITDKKFGKKVAIIKQAKRKYLGEVDEDGIVIASRHRIGAEGREEAAVNKRAIDHDTCLFVGTRTLQLLHVLQPPSETTLCHGAESLTRNSVSGSDSEANQV
jgi:pyruvate/2-oxoglutarate dehydrogenase complex dihydrolipoamide acyltransferase (E2) component